MAQITRRYFVGLDLGHAQEFTAVAALEQTATTVPETPGREIRHYGVRHLQRFPLGTPYTEVCTRMVELFSAAPLRDTTLVVDQTAVGLPVVQMLRGASIHALIRAVAITSGQQTTAA